MGCRKTLLNYVEILSYQKWWIHSAKSKLQIFQAHGELQISKGYNSALVYLDEAGLNPISKDTKF